MQECDDYDEKIENSLKQRANVLPLNLVDGDHDDDDDVDDSRARHDYDEIDEDDRDDDMEDHQKIDDRLSPDQHAKATAAAVAHISGTSEYISFAFIYLTIYKPLVRVRIADFILTQMVNLNFQFFPSARYVESTKTTKFGIDTTTKDINASISGWFGCRSIVCYVLELTAQFKFGLIVDQHAFGFN